MHNFRFIVQSGFALLKKIPGKVALYVLLAFVTQTVIQIVLVPQLLEQVTDSVSTAGALHDQPHTAASTEAKNPSYGAQASRAASGEHAANPKGFRAYLRWLFAIISGRRPANPNIVLAYLGWLFVIIAAMPLTVWFRLAQNDLDTSMEAVMRNRIFVNVLRQPPEFFAKNDPGRLTSVLTQMVTQAQQAFRSLTVEPILQFASLSIAMYVIVGKLRNMSGAVVWITMVAIALIGVFTVYIVQTKTSNAVTRSQLELQNQMLEVSSLATSAVSAPQDIQAMDAEPWFAAKYGRAIATFFGNKRKLVLTVELVNTLLGAPMQLILACLLFFVVYAATHSVAGKPAIDPGTIVALIYLVPQLMAPFKTFATLGLMANSSWPAVEMVTQLSNEPSRIADLPGAKNIEQLDPTLAIRNLTFRYEERSRKVFDDVTFEVPACKITGLVARFGQGKTTFFRLALRLYDPQQGQILIGGHATTDFTLQSLRRQISMMAQNPTFLHLSVRDNLLMAKPDASDAEIHEISVKTGLWDILESKYGPDPLNHPFAAAAGWSGGQQRTFSLTCALLRDSPFMFLDEPSTGLSADELKHLISKIRTSCTGKTVMVVDHILPAFIAPLCDYVLVLENGHIVQRGSPDQLLAEPGVFRDLYDAELTQPSASAEALPVPSLVTSPVTRRASSV